MLRKNKVYKAGGKGIYKITDSGCDTMRCPNCGYRNKDDYMFCVACGYKISGDAKDAGISRTSGGTQSPTAGAGRQTMTPTPPPSTPGYGGRGRGTSARPPSQRGMGYGAGRQGLSARPPSQHGMGYGAGRRGMPAQPPPPPTPPPPPPPPPPPAEPELIDEPLPFTSLRDGRYELDGILSIGGMGRGFLGTDTQMDASIVIKEFIPKPGVFPDKTQVERQFKEEAKVLYRLKHWNIPRVIEFFSENDSMFLVMEYIEGATLEDVIKTRPAHRITIEECVRWMIGVLEVLKYLHSQTPPVIHKDITPKNIKLTPSGEIFLVDFGISQSMTAGLPQASVKEGFASPEHYTGKFITGSDLFSLGATFHYLFTGEDPRSRGRFVFPPLARYRNDYPNQLQKIFNKLLTSVPGIRYKNADKVLKDLDFFDLPPSAPVIPVSSGKPKKSGLLGAIPSHKMGGTPSPQKSHFRPLTSRKKYETASTGSTPQAPVGGGIQGGGIAAIPPVPPVAPFGQQDYQSQKPPGGISTETPVNTSKGENPLHTSPARAEVPSPPVTPAKSSIPSSFLRESKPKPPIFKIVVIVIIIGFIVYFLAGKIMNWIAYNNWKCIYVIKEHGDAVDSVTFAPDGNSFASGCRDKIIRIWNASDMTCKNKLIGSPGLVSSVAYSPDGSLLGSGCSYYFKFKKPISRRGQKILGENRGMAQLWKVAEGKAIKSFEEYPKVVWCVTFSPDGKYFAACAEGDTQINLYDVNSGNRMKVLSGHGRDVTSISFSPDSNFLVSGSRDNKIKVWDVVLGDCIKTLKGHTGWVCDVDYSPKGRYVASAGLADCTNKVGLDMQTKDAVKIWDVKKGSCKKTLQGHRNTIRTLKYSPDGNFIASGGEDKDIRIWNAHNGACVKVLKGHTQPINSLAFSPDGKLLISSGEDGTIRVWGGK